MYTLIINAGFQAQHQLRYPDRQEPLHEHDWNVEVAVSSDRLDANELVMDFEELRLLLEAALAGFRGQQLETLEVFEYLNASAEKVASTLFSLLKPHLPADIRLDYVQVTEAPGCRARYSE